MVGEDGAEIVRLFRAEQQVTPPVEPGRVDDGPESWAVALATGIVLLAIAMSILLGSIIAAGRMA